jgi:oligopeptide/dipeptide ABC transporter ATP-binding protein
MTKAETLLQVKGLKTHFFTEDGVVRSVDGVDFDVKRGEIFGVVGESGCGKSVTSFSIMRLVGQPGKIIEGQIIFDGENLLELTEAEMVKMRGNRLSMIFQQPTSCLNPVFRVGDQIAEVLQIHQHLGREEATQRAIQLLRQVGVPAPEKRIQSFPHELSGGMAQRVMIAMALACSPELLIADEPTTALDVTIQAQILDLMLKLRNETGSAVILITHDLGVIAEMCDRVVVMYAGRVVEQTDVKTLFSKPLHPYTQGLLGAIPIMGEIKERLEVIPGSVPNLINPPTGCKFAPRCKVREETGCTKCTEEDPPLVELVPGHQVRCWVAQGVS